jgi:Tol biopolymer transport system component
MAVGSIWSWTSVAGGQGGASPASVTRRIVREVVTDFVGRGPAVSADGRYLVYAGTDNTVRIRDLTSGVDRALTSVPTDASRPNGRFAFSPDGRVVAWGWQERPGDHPQLRLVSVDGAPLNIPYNRDEWPGVGPWGNWSADGKQIVALVIKFPRSVPHTRRIGLVSVTDGSIRSLKTLPWEANPYGLSMSPDGRYIAYDYPVEEGSTDRDIFMIPTDGSEDVRLVARVADDEQPFFTPDGRGVMFFSRPRGTSDSKGAWFVPVANGAAAGRPELLSPDLGPDAAPIGFTRDGSFYFRRRSAILVMEGFLPAGASR